MKPQIAEMIPVFAGAEHSIKLPTREVIIRETNGNDDEIISKVGSSATGDNIYLFLSDITLKDLTIERKPTPDEIKQWPSNDKYGLLFKQRIINHGPKLQFEEQCPNPKCLDDNGKRTTLIFEQDLTEFDSPKVMGLGTKTILGKYPTEHPIVEFKTSSGKMLRYKRLTGVLELSQLDLPMEAVTQNTKLTIREIELYNNQEWLRIFTFHGFSSKEMAEIRNHVLKNDILFEPDIDCQCNKCKTPWVRSIFEIPAFYFPVPQM